MKENFHSELKAFFKNAGMTQADVAEAMETSQPYVNAVLNGKSTIGKEQAKKMSTLFGLGYSWLLTAGEEGEMLTDKSTTINANNNTYGDGASGNNNVTINNHAPAIIQQPPRTTEKALRPLITKALASKPETDVYEVVRREGHQMQQLEAFRQYADFDFYYQVRHDAMAPTYERGDVLALAHLAPDALIEQGAALVIDTRDYGFIFRTVYDQGDHYQCEPINPHSKFKAQQIGKDRVIRLYRVLYSVRWGD